MAIELYAWGTPNGRKISVALEEMGLPYNSHPVNISQGEQFKPEFLKISPNNRIPAIIDPEGPGGKPLSIFESGAILVYLGEKTGKFWPKGDLRAQVPVLEWLMWQMGGFGPMPGQVHHFLQVEKEEDRRYGLERYSKETHRLYGVFDKRLGEAKYAAGSEISIADFAILGWAWRHERHQFDLKDYPNVKRARAYYCVLQPPPTAGCLLLFNIIITHCVCITAIVYSLSSVAVIIITFP